MTVRLLTLIALFVTIAAPTPAMARRGRAPKGTITYRVNKNITEGRPTVTKASLSGRGPDFVLKLEFDKVAYGAGCTTRCARSTFLIDTDDDTATGLMQGPGKPPTGADLSVLVEGLEDFGEGKAAPYLRVTIRQFADGDRTIEDGDVVKTLDHRTDARIKLDRKTVTITIDASAESLPTAKTARLIYLAPGIRPLVAQASGVNKEEPRASARSDREERGGGVIIERGRRSAKPSAASVRRGARQQANQETGTSDPDKVQIKSGGSAYDPNEVSPYGEGG